MPRIHVCLVSDQPIPNLIPLCMDAYRPDKVLLLVSAQKRPQEERLSALIQKWGIATELHECPAFDFGPAHKKTISLFERHKTDDIWLNPTGGTKSYRAGNRACR